MNWFKRIARWLHTPPASTQRPAAGLSLLQERMAQARKAQYAEHYDEALRYLEQATEAANASHETTVLADIELNKADVLMYQGRYDASAALLDELQQGVEAAKLRAPLAYVLCSQGQLAQLRGGWSEATMYYESARRVAKEANLAGAGGRADGHLADIYLHEGNAAYALRLLHNALDKLKNSGDTELVPYFTGQMGQAEADSGHRLQGVDLMRHALEMATATQQRRYMRHINLLLGKQALQVADYGEAFKHYSNAVALLPQDEALTHKQQKITMLNNQSYAALKFGRLDIAESAAQQAQLIASPAPNQPVLKDRKLVVHTWATLGMVLQAKGQATEALAYLHSAQERYDDVPADDFLIDVLLSLAAARLWAGRRGEALATLEDALQTAQAAGLERQQAQVQMQLADFHQQADAIGQRDDEASIDYWSQALEFYQDAGDAAQMAHLYCQRGAARTRIGDSRRAIRDYEKAAEQLSHLQDHAARGAVLACVARTYSSQGDIETAQAFYVEATQLAEKTRDVAAEVLRRGAYGHFLVLTDRPQQAITELMSAQNLAGDAAPLPQSALWHDSLGIAHRLLNNVERALGCHQQALAALRAVDVPQQVIVLAHMAETLLASSDASQIEAAADAIGRAQDSVQQVRDVPLTIRVQIVAAQVALRQGQLDDAENALQRVASQMTYSYDKRLQVHLSAAESRLAALQGDDTRALSIWQEADILRRHLQMPEINTDWLAQT